MHKKQTGSTGLLNEQELAKDLGVSLGALRRWRVEGRGPRFIKLGSLVRYCPHDIEIWLNSRPSGGSSRNPAVAGTAS